jgi:hypothetical protein
MRHGTRQLCGQRARHGAKRPPLAQFCAAPWPTFEPPLTRRDVPKSCYFNGSSDAYGRGMGLNLASIGLRNCKPIGPDSISTQI